ncbi:MAG: 4-(cytidine 5'-diphospho)-2-C-methyl-D-erythritol kinase, partial [Solirubrobacterales bacterium]|nr:4-(cytidine 5'-diphospho)-2-C-methyl-D-erythritol kinase [Solirubrobacterales bacterium]
MTPLTALAPAKVNLCLHLGPLRPDGRHELVSIMDTVSLADRLVLESATPDGSGGAAPDAGLDGDEVRCPGVAGPNLAASALAAFRAATGWSGPPLLLRIDKRIPVAGG